MEYVAWGIDIILAMFPESTSRKNVVKYYPLMEGALNDAGLIDTKMKLATYATIRAESAGFAPINEKKSKFNTLESIDVANLQNQNIKDLGALMNATIKTYQLDNRFGKYDYMDKGLLGNNAHGDGEKYKGRGFIQLTGKSNYLIFSKALDLPELFTNPDLALEPKIASQITAAFIKRASKRMATALQNNDLAAARKAVNNGTHGLDRFQTAYAIGVNLALPKDRDFARAAV